MPTDFNSIFSSVEKKLSKDPHARIYNPGDITMGSFIPYGIPTRIPQLDLALKHPGLPAGKIVEFFGFEYSGKTTAALHLIASIQKMGGAALLIDTERAFDEDRASNLSIDIEKNFKIIETDTIESTFRSIDSTIKSLIDSEWNKPSIVVVDSITGVQSECIMEQDFGAEPRVGQDARTIRGGSRKLLPLIAKSKALVVFINHAISTIASNKYAKQSMAAGGHALKFASTVRIEFKGGADLKTPDKEKVLGKKVYIKIEKLRGELESPGFEAGLLNRVGFDMVEGLLEALVSAGVVTKPNSKTYRLDDQDIEFAKGDWASIIESLGGIDAMYGWFLKRAQELGIIKPWSIING